jgi:hypothetical protein
MMIYRHKLVLTVFLFMLIAASAFGCVNATTPAATPTSAPAAAAAPTKTLVTAATAITLAGTAAPIATSTTAVSQNLNGAHVSILGLWSGPELDNFLIVKAAWEKDAGGIVDWEGTQDLDQWVHQAVL